MHPEVLEWVGQFATDRPVTVLDIGGRDVNGSTRPLFPRAIYTVLDIRPGEGVDIVADAAAWTPDREYDLVVCTEVFEHTSVWPDICATAHKALRPGGRIIVTCAGPGRAPHSAMDEAPIRPDEWYANVSKRDLYQVLAECGFTDVTVETQRLDTRAVATK